MLTSETNDEKWQFMCCVSVYNFSPLIRENRSLRLCISFFLYSVLIILFRSCTVLLGLDFFLFGIEYALKYYFPCIKYWHISFAKWKKQSFIQKLFIPTPVGKFRFHGRIYACHSSQSIAIFGFNCFKLLNSDCGIRCYAKHLA